MAAKVTRHAFWLACLLLLPCLGCASSPGSGPNLRSAYLAGQSDALRQMSSTSESPSVTIVGPVRFSKVPWVDGLTLVQAIASADYLPAQAPRQIILSRAGDSATLDPGVLFGGAVIPLEAGDIVELRP